MHPFFFIKSLYHYNNILHNTYNPQTTFVLIKKHGNFNTAH